MGFIIIEQIVDHKNAAHLKQLLLTSNESLTLWTSQLFSLHPHGLNKRREFRSRNRICFIIVDYVISIYSDPSGLAY